MFQKLEFRGKKIFVITQDGLQVLIDKNGVLLVHGVQCLQIIISEAQRPRLSEMSLRRPIRDANAPALGFTVSFNGYEMQTNACWFVDYQFVLCEVEICDGFVTVNTWDKGPIFDLLCRDMVSRLELRLSSNRAICQAFDIIDKQIYPNGHSPLVRALVEKFEITPKPAVREAVETLWQLGVPIADIVQILREETYFMGSVAVYLVKLGYGVHVHHAVNLLSFAAEPGTDKPLVHDIYWKD